MGGFKLVVLSRPVEGRESDYNAWYSDQHLADVVAQAGFKAARRYRVKAPVVGIMQRDYLAIYEMDVPDQEQAIAAASALGGAGLDISDSLDVGGVICALYAPVRDVLPAEPAPAGSYLILSFNGPASGSEAAFDDWYENTHMRECMEIPGFASSERFRLVHTLGGEVGNPFLAIYTLQADSPEEVEAFNRRAAETTLTPTDTIDIDSRRIAMFEPISHRVEAQIPA